MDSERDIAVSASDDAEQRRRRESIERAVAASRRRRLFAVALVLVMLVLGSLLITAQAGRALLDAAHAHVTDQHRAWTNAVAVQNAAEAANSTVTGADEGDSVAIARQRYDEAAMVYNDRAASLPGRLALWVFDLPGHVPLSDSVSQP